MTNGYLGRIYNFKPLFFYKINDGIFKVVPDNTLDSKPCLIDTGYNGYLILPDTEENKNVSIHNIFFNSKIKLANNKEIESQYAFGFFQYRMSNQLITFYFADIPEAVMGMQLISWFEKVTFDSNENDVTYKKR